MRVHRFLASSVLLGCFVACAPAPKNPQMPPVAGTPTTKPTGVSSSQVGMFALTEISHIERAMKPLNGVALSGVAPLVEPTAVGCRTTQTTNRAQWETTWKCGVDPKVSGRKEIIGVERLNYDQTTRTLTYDGKFEIKNFNDLEPRAQAHTLVTARKIKIRFDRGSTTASARATVAMTSIATVSAADGKIVPGSNYRSSLDGVLLGQGTDWTLTKSDTVLNFEGALYGLDADRKTLWASGTFRFVPEQESGIKLLGLGDSSCTKPIGDWRMSAIGGGDKLDTTMQTSETGGVSVSGSVAAWPIGYCERP